MRDNYLQELEADLRQKYQVRLTDLYRRKFSFRELLSYVEGVVQDPRSLTRIAYDPRDAWDNVLESLNYIYAALTGKNLPHRPVVDLEEALERDPEQRASLRAAQRREDQRQANLSAEANSDRES